MTEPFLRRMVMDAISNDYEPLEEIVKDVGGWMVEDGMAADPLKITEALLELVSDNLADAYLLFVDADAKHLFGEEINTHLNDCFFLLNDLGVLRRDREEAEF